MKTATFVLTSLLLGCASDKLPDPGPEFGEDTLMADAKADSIARPSSSEPIAFGAILTARFDARAKYRAYTFTGVRGQQVDLYVDGLADLDTVLYLYNAKNGAPTGRSLVFNDDTATPGWIVRSNPVANELSASTRYSLPADGSYALVASTYGRDGVGKAEVTIETPAASLTDAQVLELAKAYAWNTDVEPGTVRHLFENEAAAYAWLQTNQPTGGLEWLAYDGDATHFVEGTNDLWSQRFEVARADGAITVTAEH